MKPLLMFTCLCLLVTAPGLHAQTAPEDQYFNVYNLIVKGDQLMEKGKPASARTNYTEAQTQLKRLQEDFPLWNKQVVKFRLSYLSEKLTPPAATPAAPAHAPAHTTGASTAPAAESKTTADDSAVTLKLKWQTGKRYNEQIKIAGSMTQTVPSQNQPMTMKYQLDLSQDLALSVLKDTDGGGHEVQLELGGTALDVKNGATTMVHFDSAQPPPDNADDQLTSAMKKLAGAKLKFVTDADGKPVSVENLDEFLTTIMGPEGKSAADSLNNMPGMSDNLKNAMANSSGLPDKPVKVGDSWSKNTDVPAGAGSISSSTTYTFTGWETHNDRKCAVIQLSGDMTPKDGAAGPMNMKMQVSGTMWFDPELGAAVDSQTKLAMNMQMGANANQAVKMNLNANIGFKLAKLEDIPQ